jgi:hypothetical protein
MKLLLIAALLVLAFAGAFMELARGRRPVLVTRFA